MVRTVETPPAKDGETTARLTPANDSSSSWKMGFELLLRIVLGGLFIYSGGIKVMDPTAFQTDIANFQILPWSLSGLVALYLPWLEIICGGALILKKQFGGGLLVLSLLMVAFILFLGSAWARGLDVSCGCFGASENATNYPWAIARNLLILAGLGTLAWISDSVKRNRLTGN